MHVYYCEVGNMHVYITVKWVICMYITVKWVIFAACNFRYIRDLLMEGKFKSREILLNYITHTVNIN